MLQSTLGNLPELFIVLFSLSAGELVVAQFSILGSLFANALLVLGLAIVGGCYRGARAAVMRFEKRLPNDTATLLLLVDLPDRAARALGSGRRPGERAPGRDLGRRCDLPARRLRRLARRLPASRHQDASGRSRSRRTRCCRSPGRSGCSAAAGVSAALVSEWFVDAIDPAVEKLGISKAFTGLVIVAIAGNAVENVVAVQLAMKGKSDLAISVVKNSVAQIACFLFPVLVLVSLLFDEQLTFVINPVFIGALALTAIAVWQITGDGEAVALRGLGADRALRRARDARLVRVVGSRARITMRSVDRDARPTQAP